MLLDVDDDEPLLLSPIRDHPTLTLMITHTFSHLLTQGTEQTEVF